MSIEGPPKIEKNMESEKEARIKDVEKQVDETRDALGYPIDPGIKDAVVSFNLLGLPTHQSCEGHIEEGIPAPWIQIEALNRPEEQFVNEKKIYKKIAEKYNIPAEDVERGINHDAWVEAAKEVSKNDETEEYKEWYKKNGELMKKAQDLIDEFYKDRQVDLDIKIQIKQEAEGFRIHNGGEDYDSMAGEKREPSEEQKKIVLSSLEKYRAEMSDFAEFLKDKFLKE